MGVMWGGAIGAPLIWNAKGSGFRLSLGWCRSGFDLFGVGETFIGNLSELVLRLSAGGRASGSAGSRTYPRRTAPTGQPEIGRRGGVAQDF